MVSTTVSTTMLFLQIMAIVMACFSRISAAASTLPSSIEGKPLPDRWFQFNITEPRATDETNLGARNLHINDLVEREPIDVCMAINTAAACVTIIRGLVSFADTMGATIKSLSKQHSCQLMTGTFDNIKWSYYSTGRHCDTTAQQKTISGAIAKYIRNAEHGKICGTQCLRLNHGGTWDGWLKLGSVSSFNEHAYCGPGLSFDSCVSGGKHDI